MKSTGITRAVDELGRVVIPVELRRGLGIEHNDPLEIYVEGDKIILKKSVTGCVFCGGTNKLTELEGKFICASCMKKLAKLEK